MHNPIRITPATQAEINRGYERPVDLSHVVRVMWLAVAEAHAQVGSSLTSDCPRQAREMPATVQIKRAGAYQRQLNGKCVGYTAGTSYMLSQTVTIRTKLPRRLVHIINGQERVYPADMAAWRARFAKVLVHELVHAMGYHNHNQGFRRVLVRACHLLWPDAVPAVVDTSGATYDTDKRIQAHMMAADLDGCWLDLDVTAF